MRNRKYFPFERNRYYFGKLLTAKDLEAEQRYMNDKRRFTNRLSTGSGIVAGLGVVMADDTSIILQAGCAYDSTGREIVVPETKVLKLSTIEGYQQLETNRAYLELAYDEQPADPVYAAMSEEEEGGSYNKVREGYRLILTDESMVARLPGQTEEFITPLTLYSDPEIVLTQYAPKFAVPGRDVAIRVELTRIGHGPGEYSFAYRLEIPGFTCEGRPGPVMVEENKRKLAHGETHTITLHLTPLPYLWGGDGSGVTLAADSLTVRRNDESFQLNTRLTCSIRPVKEDLTSFFLSACYQKSMDKALEDTADERLWIAAIDLVRQKSACLIDSVSPAPFRQYAYNPLQLMQLRMLEGYYPMPGGAERPAGEYTLPARAAEPAGEVQATASGVFDLGLGFGYGTRVPAVSEEVMHGLGKGPVYVEVGVEYITAGGPEGESSEVILGDAALFSADREQHTEERIYQLRTAVKLLPERGTFMVAVLPGETSGLISLRIRWFAMRVNETGKQQKTARDGEKYLLINPDTVVVAPKGTAHITPVFINMPTEACEYRMIDGEGGTIDSSGVYTAPAKEGVYEIHVAALSDPSVYARAFAIVTQKKKPTEEQVK